MTSPTKIDDVRLLKETAEFKTTFLSEIEKVVVGQRQVLEEILTTIFARGHALILGVPGLAKTLIVRSVADLLQLQFRRIQFTPDLTPSDILGANILQDEGKSGTRRLCFVPGPVFSNIVLADEINRTPPRTQAALLEAMQEGQVSINGVSRKLDEPFFVLATQNPIEQEGTYPLPESQLDRFTLCVKIDYPASKRDEVDVVLNSTSDSIVRLRSILTKERFLTFQGLVRRVPIPRSVAEFAVELVRRTRPTSEESPDFVRKYLNWGAGPRAAQCLVLTAKADAALSGRPVAGIAEIRKFAVPVLRHRLVLNYLAQADGVSVEQIVRRILDSF